MPKERSNRRLRISDIDLDGWTIDFIEIMNGAVSDSSGFRARNRLSFSGSFINNLLWSRRSIPASLVLASLEIHFETATRRYRRPFRHILKTSRRDKRFFYTN